MHALLALLIIIAILVVYIVLGVLYEIMMTTMAAMLGALPMAVGYGAGSEARRPLGLTVVGGLFFSQLMTLYLTPVVYTYLSHLAEYLTGWKQRRSGRGRLAAAEGD